MASFGGMVKILRERQGGGGINYIRQEELAKRLKWPLERIKKIEKGMEIPTKDEIVIMGKAIGLARSAIDQLIEMSEKPDDELSKPRKGRVIVCQRPGGCSVIETESWEEKMEKLY